MFEMNTYQSQANPVRENASVVFDFAREAVGAAVQIFRLPSADRYIAELIDEPREHLF